MAQTGPRVAIYEDLLALPEHLIGELIGGELFTSPRPAPRHARASSRLGAALDGPFDRGQGGPGGWIALDEPELHLSTDVLVPDLAGWRRDRMPALPTGAAFDLAPDWVESYRRRPSAWIGRTSCRCMRVSVCPSPG